jgi:hypothetical protein
MPHLPLLASDHPALAEAPGSPEPTQPEDHMSFNQPTINHPPPRDTYMPERGRFRTGDRVRYIGPPRRFHPRTGIVQTGDVGTVVHDFGFDYRYLIRFDRLIWGRIVAYDGIAFDIRPGNSWSDWEPER